MCPDGVSRDAVPMPPLKPRQLIPVPAPTAPSAGAGPPAEARAAASAAPTSAVVTCIRRASLRKLSSHSATIGMITSSVPIPGVLRHQQLAGRVVHPAQLHRRGQEHRGLGQAPLAGRQKARALARAVEHRAPGRDRAAEQVAAEVDDRHPGPGHPAARPAADGSSRQTVAWPTPTPGTSTIEAVGPLGKMPIVIPRSAARLIW